MLIFLRFFGFMFFTQRIALRLIHSISSLDAAATIFFVARFLRLLFEGGVYFFGNPQASTTAG